ncbi:MAG TPA: FtsX-like permease family protein [Cytophagaceae bacterium]|jgi:lipoprotein-releasing system permease protein|nr:FtsX-like permease family protein [Cytophagaceae bacterium]
MKAILLVAGKYFIPSGKLNMIHVISLLSISVVAVVTMALVVGMAFFNGMDDLIRSLFNSFDPQIKVQPAKGKTFLYTQQLYNNISHTTGVDYITDVIEDNCVVMYANQSDVVKIKGVADNFTQQGRIDTFIVEGGFKLKAGEKNYAILGRGVASKLSVNVNNPFTPLTFYYPNKAKLQNLSSTSAFNIVNVQPGGVFAIEKQYDDHYVIVPLSIAQQLMNYSNQRSYLEIKVKAGEDIEEVKNRLVSLMGSDFKILNSEEQHDSLIRAMHIEKIIVNLMLTFILAVSSVGIFFCLSMLVIQKRNNIAVLFSFGSSRTFIRNVFLTEGALISLSGTFIGMSMGILLCYLQQQYGLVSIGTETSLVDAYPVRLKSSDLVITFLSVLVITFLASIRPALVASNVQIREYL